MTTCTRARFFPVLALAMLIPAATAAAQGGGAGLDRVAQAILAWDGENPGDLFKAVKAANPDAPAIVSMRELNAAIEAGTVPAEVRAQAEAITSRQKAAQAKVRQQVLASQQRAFRQWIADHPGALLTIYGYGDIGSWVTADNPDISMDVDWTVLGTNPDATAALRDACKADLLRTLAGEGSGLDLPDFDVVITAQGHEAQAKVFETEGGIDWAKRNVRRVAIVHPDGTVRLYELGGANWQTGVGGDPVAEIAYAEHMATFRELAIKNGDYSALFDDKGFLKEGLFDNPDDPNVKALWDKYTRLLADSGVDYYRSRSETAAGGALDMAKHLQEEVLTKKDKAPAKFKKTLKYVERADNIIRGVADLGRLAAVDPILGDPAYREVVEMSRKMKGAPEAAIAAALAEHFGNPPDAGLAELGNKARRTILRMSELAFQAEMDRIILELSDPNARKIALDKLASDFGIIANEGGDYSDLSRAALDQIAKIQDANETGAIDEIRKNYQSLEAIRQSEQGLVSRTVEFLRQTNLGSKMLDMGGKLLEIGNKSITQALHEAGGPKIEWAEGMYKSATAEYVSSVVDSARATGQTVVTVLGSAAMWVEVIDSVRRAKSDADLAIALGRTLINNTFFGMVLNSAYAGIVLGDNDALGKAVMYMLVPEAALPALVEALGNSAINMSAQMLFDAQMEDVYQATTFDENGITDFGGLGEAGIAGATYYVDKMADGEPRAVAQDIVSRSKATDMGKGVNAIGITMIAASIRATVENGRPLIFTEDGPLRAAGAGIQQITQEINDCAKIWGVEVALSADFAEHLPGGLDGAQVRALAKLLEKRLAKRTEARAALANAMVRTFLERHRAETSLDTGKARAEYDALLQIFQELNIVREGTRALNEEGAPSRLGTDLIRTGMGPIALASYIADMLKPGGKPPSREALVKAVTAVEKFLDAYRDVLQMRERAEETALPYLGAGGGGGLGSVAAGASAFAERPLTGSLPLTGRPESDVQIARAYLGELGPLGPGLVQTMELIKQAKLEGDYDLGMLSRMYEVRLREAYQKSVAMGASEAQQLHWALEIFDKQALYNKGDEASRQARALHEEYRALEEEFREHYAVRGEFVVELTGPAEIQSGDDAALVAKVFLRAADGTMSPVPADIDSQLSYSWLSGKASLGDSREPTRSYRLDTPGTHTFTVAVKRRMIKGDREALTDVGSRASWSVKVAAPPGAPVGGVDDPAGGGGKPPGGGEKPPGEPVKPPGPEKPGTKPDTPGVDPPPPVPGTPTGGGAPSAPAAAGHWLLSGVQEQRAGCRSEYWSLTNCSVTLSGNSVVTSADFSPDSEEGGVRGAPAKSMTARSTTMAGELPKSVAPGVAVSTALRADGGYVAPSEGNIPPQGSMVPYVELRAGSGSVSRVSAGQAGTHQWSLAAGSATDATRAITITHWGPGGSLTRTYSYTWTAGAPALVVDITRDRQAPTLGETVTLSAAVTGGTPPYTYAWTGPATGTATKLPFTVAKPGRHDFTVIVTDATGAKVSAAASVEAAAFTATVSLASGQARIVPGQSLTFSAQVNGPPGVSPPAGLVYRWQPNTEVTFPPESAARQVSGQFPTVGKYKVWVDVMQPVGTTYSTLAVSNQIEIEVVAPEISLSVAPSDPYPGQEVRVTVSERPAVGDALISYWWEYKGNATNPGAGSNPRVYSFRPKDTTPVTVIAHAKAVEGGAELGTKEVVVTARAHDVKVSGPTARGPKPRIWDPKRRELVEVATGLAVFQDLGMRVDLEPAAANAPARYAWSITPEGCTLSNPASQEPTVNCRQTGSYTASVSVRDSQGAELGKGAGQISISISQADLQNSQQQAEAEKQAQAQAQAARETAGKLRAEAQALQNQGKLREAAAKYKESLKYVPDPKLVEYIGTVEAAAAQQEEAARQAVEAEKQKQAQAQTARATAGKLRAEAQALQNQGKLREAAAKYKESLKYLPDPQLEQYIGTVEAAAAQQEEAARQAVETEKQKQAQAALKAEQDRKAAEALRAAEAARAERERREADVRKAEEARKSDADRKAQEALRAAEAARADRERRAEEVRKALEAAETQKPSQTGGTSTSKPPSTTSTPKPTTASTQSDDERRAAEARQAEQQRREEQARRDQEERTRKAAEVKSAEDKRRQEDARRAEEERRRAESACSLTGTWAGRDEALAYTLQLQHTGNRLTGSLKACDVNAPSVCFDPESGEGTVSGSTVRLTFDGTMSGDLSDDCRTITFRVDGEVLVIRRR